MGGNDSTSGNVFAFNPATGIVGPVCDHGWGFYAVSFLFVAKNQELNHTQNS